MSESLKHKTLKGTIWSSIERFSVQSVQFIVMLFMARLLTPADYGLVGMLTIFISLFQSLVDSGFSNALIRKIDRTEVDNSTVFYFNIACGIILYAIMFFGAPLIAEFYNQPELTDLARVISLSLILNSFAVVQYAQLTIKIDFKTQSKASLTAAVSGGIVGIIMALNGFGVWAIVANQLVNIFTTVVMLWILSAWRPKWVYSWSSFRELFSYGSKLAASSIIDTVYRNGYQLVIGKVFKASDLGYYTRANQFAQLPSSNITSILGRVTFPILCTIQNDDERLQSVYRRFLRLSAFIIFPLMIGLAAIARPLVITLLEEKWAFSATLLTIICFSMMWYPIHSINLNLLQVKGRSDLFLKLEIIKKIIGIIILFITVPMGLIAMCIGSVFSSIIALAINTHYTGKLINVGFFKQMLDLCPSLAYSLSMGMIVYLSTIFFESYPFQLLIGTLVGMLYYICITYITGSKDLKELKSFIKSK